MTVSEEEGRFTLWQLPEQSDTQMMSYIIRAADGKLIVIDGGTQRDAGYLKGFVAALGESVEAWFLTHPHSDHTDALVEILRRPGGIAIGTIYVSLPDLGWIRQYGSNDEQDTPMRLEAALKASGIHVVELSAGQEVSVGGVRTEVLRVWNPGIHANALNNASLVLRVSDGSKSVLRVARSSSRDPSATVCAPTTARWLITDRTGSRASSTRPSRQPTACGRHRDGCGRTTRAAAPAPARGAPSRSGHGWTRWASAATSSRPTGCTGSSESRKAGDRRPAERLPTAVRGRFTSPGRRSRRSGRSDRAPASRR